MLDWLTWKDAVLATAVLTAFLTEQIVPGRSYRRTLRHLDRMVGICEKQQNRLERLERKVKS